MREQPLPITDLLRRAILESKMPYKALASETGIQRTSIMRSVHGAQSLRVDMADKLAAYVGLHLVQHRKG
jgi:plasmid maintenance system antidote protein VapI